MNFLIPCFIAFITCTIIWTVFSWVDKYCGKKLGKQEAQEDNNKLLQLCVKSDEAAQYMTNLKTVIPKLLTELKCIHPYESYALPNPPYHSEVNLYIMADKEGMLKFVVSNRVMSKDNSHKDYYLNHCYNLDGQLSDFIKECEDANFKCNLEVKRKEKIKNTIRSLISH